MDNSKNRTTPEKYLHELYEVEVYLLTLGKIIVIYNLYNATTPFWHNINVENPWIVHPQQIRGQFLILLLILFLLGVTAFTNTLLYLYLFM